MNNKLSLNMKISLLILIPIITIILIFGIINTIYTYKMTKQMTLFIISQMAQKEIFEIERILDLEVNYLNNVKYSVENLYNYDVRKRSVYEDLMNRLSYEMSTNAISVSLIFLTNSLDNDNMYINNDLYKDINGQFGISLVKDMDSISRVTLKESDLEYTYLNTTINTRKPNITTLNYYPMQGKYKPMYTYTIPIFSKDNEMIAVSSLNISLDNIVFYDDTNGFTISLFNEKGYIMYCTTDIYSIGANITNLSDVYGRTDLESTVYSNNTIWKESYNKKKSSKYFNLFAPLHIFDNLYWGIELAVDSKADFFKNYKIIIMIWIVIAVIILFISIIVPLIINKKVLSVINNANNEMTKINEIDTSTSISENSNDMSKFAYKVNDGYNRNYNKIRKNKNSKIVNNVNGNFKSLLEESKDLQKIIKYFRLRE